MDEINLKLPAKPEYVSVIRLTTAAIANRLGFSIDEIEDLKVAVSEACIYLINQFSVISLLTIDYHIQNDRSVTATVTAIGASGINTSEGKENELSLFIIESVADKITRHIENGIIKRFSIYKTGGGSFE